MIVFAAIRTRNLLGLQNRLKESVRGRGDLSPVEALCVACELFSEKYRCLPIFECPDDGLYHLLVRTV